jgi:hypothetical protein
MTISLAPAKVRPPAAPTRPVVEWASGPALAPVDTILDTVTASVQTPTEWVAPSRDRRQPTNPNDMPIGALRAGLDDVVRVARSHVERLV